jgi:hypothetical protein
MLPALFYSTMHSELNIQISANCNSSARYRLCNQNDTTRIIGTSHTCVPSRESATHVTPCECAWSKRLRHWPLLTRHTLILPSRLPAHGNSNSPVKVATAQHRSARPGILHVQ